MMKQGRWKLRLRLSCHRGLNDAFAREQVGLVNKTKVFDAKNLTNERHIALLY